MRTHLKGLPSQTSVLGYCGSIPLRISPRYSKSLSDEALTIKTPNAKWCKEAAASSKLRVALLTLDPIDLLVNPPRGLMGKSLLHPAACSSARRPRLLDRAADRPAVVRWRVPCLAGGGAVRLRPRPQAIVSRLMSAMGCDSVLPKAGLRPVEREVPHAGGQPNDYGRRGRYCDLPGRWSSR